MLHNDGQEKQQTPVTKRVKTKKGVRQVKKATKRNSAAGQKDHFKFNADLCLMLHNLRY